jgi:hypothetical protein
MEPEENCIEIHADEEDLLVSDNPDTEESLNWILIKIAPASPHARCISLIKDYVKSKCFIIKGIYRKKSAVLIEVLANNRLKTYLINLFEERHYGSHHLTEEKKMDIHKLCDGKFSIKFDKNAFFLFVFPDIFAGFAISDRNAASHPYNAFGYNLNNLLAGSFETSLSDSLLAMCEKIRLNGLNDAIVGVRMENVDKSSSKLTARLIIKSFALCSDLRNKIRSLCGSVSSPSNVLFIIPSSLIDSIQHKPDGSMILTAFIARNDLVSSNQKESKLLMRAKVKASNSSPNKDPQSNVVFNIGSIITNNYPSKPVSIFERVGPKLYDNNNDQCVANSCCQSNSPSLRVTRYFNNSMPSTSAQHSSSKTNIRIESRGKR